METRVLSIPLNKLAPSARNVRRTGREIGIEALAASISAHGLLQNLTVLPVHKQDKPTGTYEVIAGGRRLLALKSLAKAKQIAKDATIDCLVLAEGSAEEVSLAENVVRENLHPADQFEAFKRLVDEEGLGCEAIAARFGVTAAVVRQRLRLAAVSPVLMQAYRDSGMTLDQLMAFTVTEDHARQEMVWESLSWKDPSAIRRALAEDRVRATDRRAVFVGAEAYEAAGGVIERDLFTDDQGGFFADPGLLDRLALEKLTGVAEAIQAAGWKWASVCLDYPHANGLHRVYPKVQRLSEPDQARLDELEQQYETLADEYEAEDDLPEAVVAELDAIAVEMEALRAQQSAYDPEEIARSGVFVVLDQSGRPRIEAGFVRSEDKRPAAPSSDEEPNAKDGGETSSAAATTNTDGVVVGPLSDRLVADLTAHRTAALRDRLAENTDIALQALVHAFALQTFYPGYSQSSCLDCRITSAGLSGFAPGIGESVACQKIDHRASAWVSHLPESPADLWSIVGELNQGERLALLAHCVSLGINVVRSWENRSRALSHADQLAAALGLDMTAYWRPTVTSYFGQVTKAHILDAVREAVSDDAARRIEGAKKPAMADAAEGLLSETTWLPAMLRSPRTEAAEDAPADA
jgi:ParB family transcriptional regulator, chromosome partitioning protein